MSLYRLLILVLTSSVLLILAMGCASLPNRNTTQLADVQIEYSLVAHAATAPVVVFENGLAGRMEWWRKVIPAISADATTFAYNRPGYGGSSTTTTARDGQHVSDELRALLQSLDLHPPYILVGHSLGALYLQLFARKYPEEVRALILVDSTHPEQFKGKGAMANWPSWFRFLFMLYLSPTEQEELSLITTTGEMVLALPTITGKPVVVLSALKPMRDHSELADDANRKRENIVRLYPGAKQVWVESGHGIPLEQPEAVIKAIREILVPESTGNK